MSIQINDAIPTPDTIPNGAGTINVSFEGSALEDNTKVKVSFAISPFPILSFDGSKSDSGEFVFDIEAKSFSKTLSIKNANEEPSTDDLPKGLIRLYATELATGYVNSTYAEIYYK